eukprot:COSAG02_NODE_1603_length_11734_cov_5.828105_6_plen_335_part_00
MEAIRRAAGEYARSSIITVTNRTDTSLRLTGQFLVKGSWCTGFTPPEIIHPRSEAVFAGSSESTLGIIPTGGTMGSVVYETMSDDQNTRSSVWTFELSWSNPLFIRDARGRYVEYKITQPEHRWSLEEYSVLADGVDQDENNEVGFIIARNGDEKAKGDIGVESGLNLAPGEVTHAGLLEKCNASGLAWERRLFMLTDTKLLYTENKRSRTAKRVLQLVNISNVQADDFQPHEFSVVMRKDATASNAGDAGREFRLRAVDHKEAAEWMRRINTAVQQARSAIHVNVSNALNKYERITCQPTDRVIDLKHAIAGRFGVDTDLQVGYSCRKTTTLL